MPLAARLSSLIFARAGPWSKQEKREAEGRKYTQLLYRVLPWKGGGGASEEGHEILLTEL